MYKNRHLRQSWPPSPLTLSPACRAIIIAIYASVVQTNIFKLQILIETANSQSY